MLKSDKFMTNIDVSAIAVKSLKQTINLYTGSEKTERRFSCY